MTTGLFYAGIGSRQTPPEVLSFMQTIAGFLSARHFILRSGGAIGADSAFEQGAGQRRQIFLPWNGYNQKISPYHQVTPPAVDMAARFHPAFRSLSPAAVKLMARNSYQVLGPDLATPSLFVVCWTPDGCTGQAERTRATGGTGQAIAIADANQIPVINLQRVEHLRFVEAKMNGVDPEVEITKLFPNK